MGIYGGQLFCHTNCKNELAVDLNDNIVKQTPFKVANKCQNVFTRLTGEPLELITSDFDQNSCIRQLKYSKPNFIKEHVVQISFY